MTLVEFMRTVYTVAPDATVLEDADGQLIIHTGLQLAEGGSLVAMTDEGSEGEESAQ